MKKFFFTLLAISFLPVIAFADEPPELRKLRQEAINLYFKARSEEDKTNKHDLYKKALEKTNFLIKVAPNYVDALKLRSEIKLDSNVSLNNANLSYEKDLEGALQDINRAINFGGPEDPSLYTTRADIYIAIWEQTNSHLDSIKKFGYWYPFMKTENCKNIKYYRYCDKKLDEERKLEIISMLKKLSNSSYLNVLENFDKAISIKKTDFHFYERAIFFGKNKEYERAISDINKAIDLSSGYWSIAYTKWRIRFNRLSGNLSAACKDYILIKDNVTQDELSYVLEMDGVNCN